MNRRQIIASAAATAALGILPLAAEAAPPRLLSTIGTPIGMTIAKHVKIIDGRPEWVYQMIVSYDGAGDTVIQDERRFRNALNEYRTRCFESGREFRFQISHEDLHNYNVIRWFA